MSSVKHIVLTGFPGVGKTTLIKKVCDALKAENVCKIDGFYTEDVRNETGSRIGFDIVTLGGKRRRLSRTLEYVEPGNESKYKVGQYTVFLNEFESVALPTFESENEIIVIDEIGKMELFSENFKQKVVKTFKDPKKIIIATIPVAKGKPISLVENIRSSDSTHLITVNKNNRNNLLNEIVSHVKSCL
ncbi:cancer-related nucleoside-triphosphatase homolog [Agrilus planipennis]|uniref:Cancer-related nucleoside-triphosphatase homolog n=1 Tax=Agrilus planipennis TaxID=224129 RepID=A0A1W4XNG5_AGRPL|nr:cancer-related nucleoside-triphosphatase homolog [Agrilus planipennis]